MSPDKARINKKDISTTLDIRGKKTKFSLLFPYLDRSGEVSLEIVKK